MSHCSASRARSARLIKAASCAFQAAPNCRVYCCGSQRRLVEFPRFGRCSVLARGEIVTLQLAELTRGIGKRGIEHQSASIRQNAASTIFPWSFSTCPSWRYAPRGRPADSDRIAIGCSPRRRDGRPPSAHDRIVSRSAGCAAYGRARCDKGRRRLPIVPPRGRGSARLMTDGSRRLSRWNSGIGSYLTKLRLIRVERRGGSDLIAGV